MLGYMLCQSRGYALCQAILDSGIGITGSGERSSTVALASLSGRFNRSKTFPFLFLQL